MTKCVDYAFIFRFRAILLYYISKETIWIFLTLPKDQPSSILFMPHSSWMFSASLSRTFSKWGGMTIWRHRGHLSTRLSYVSPLHISAVHLPGWFPQVWGWRRPVTWTEWCPTDLWLLPRLSCTLSPAPPSASLSAAEPHNMERNLMEAETWSPHVDHPTGNAP